MVPVVIDRVPFAVCELPPAIVTAEPSKVIALALYNWLPPRTSDWVPEERTKLWADREPAPYTVNPEPLTASARPATIEPLLVKRVELTVKSPEAVCALPEPMVTEAAFMETLEVV